MAKPGNRDRMFARLRNRSWTRIWSWAFGAQAVSSATTLALSLLGGRVLGTSGLGVVFLGFTAYLLALALVRALIVTPLISTSSTLDANTRHTATRSAITVTLAVGVGLAVVIAGLGKVLNGPAHEGLLVFAPWLVFTFARELFRASLFRDGSGGRAALMDGAWLVTMLALVPIAVWSGTPWAVVAVWGSGSVVAAAMGAWWLRALPARPSQSWHWFVHSALPFGRWLTLQEGMFSLGFYALILILAGIVGTGDLGGLRAAETIFAPVTLLAPVFLLAGLPSISRALVHSRTQAVEVAAALSVTAVILTLTYSAIMIVVGPTLLAALFGSAFSPYSNLVLPISAGQVALAAGVGFVVLLSAERRGKAIITASAAAIATSLLASPLLASHDGIRGAAWGMSAGLVVGSCLDVYFGLRATRLPATKGAPQPPAVASPLGESL